MILIYTGNGKGKTSASVGQTIRALGHDMKVGFVQFMKGNENAGEQIMLRRLLGDMYQLGGIGFFRKEEDRPPHREAAVNTLGWVMAHVADLDLLVLDESIYALKAGLITREEVEALLAKAEEHSTHIVLSGRDAPEWLREKADLVTEMGEVKHPWQQGIHATKGIEF